MSFGFGFALPHWQTLSGGAFNPLSLFQGGVQGAWYDPSDASTLYSDTAGTTPSPTPGAGALSVVGAMLDKRALDYSVFFDGTGDYFSTPNATALQLTNSVAFTLECWINPSSIGTARFVFKNYLDSGLFSGYGFGIGCDGADSLFQFWDGNVWRKFALLSANVWTHVAITYEGSGTTGRVFINGTQSGASFTVNSNINATTGTALVGAQSVSSGFFPGYISNLRIVKGIAVYTGNFTPPTSPLSPISGTSLLTCGTSWTGNPVITVAGDCKISQINPFVASPLGNHAISYNTTTARPELSARVNLLTYSEDQSNGVWVNYNATQQSNVGIAPDGTNTADRIIETSGAAPQARYQSIGAGLSIQYTVSAYAKAGERSVFNLSYSGTAGANWFAATFDLTGNGQVTKTGAGASGTYTSSSITPVGNGWYRCQVTGNTNQVSGHFVYGGPSDTTNPTYGSFGVPTYTGNTSNGVLVWGFDVRPANIGTSVPSYQRIADQYTYDSSGFPRYLVFNGTASGMYTPANLNLSGTDKATVFAGIRKISDAAAGILTELSVNQNLNAGSFLITVPNGANTVFDATLSQGNTITYNSASYTDLAAPITTVNSISFDKALSTDEVVFIRKNGANQSLTRSLNGNTTGNFGSYPLFIGSRNNGSIWLNGYIYSLIVVGAASTAAQISSTESWINGKEGGVY